MVELAVAMILLTMMLLGAVEVGFAYNNYMLAKKATYSAALVGAYGGSDGDVKYAVLQGCENMISTNFFYYGLSDTGIEIAPDEQSRAGSIIDYDTGGSASRKDIGVLFYYQIGFMVPMSNLTYCFELPVMSIMPMVKPCERDIADGGGADIIPLSIDDGVALVYGSVYTFKYAGGSGSDGNYSCLALGGSGANTYENNLTYGFNGTVIAGGWIQTEPGNISGPTTDGVNYRMNGHTGHTYATYSGVCPNCPRVVTIPVLDLDSVNGKTTLQVKKLANFYLTGVGGSGAQCYVTGNFLGYAG